MDMNHRAGLPFSDRPSSIVLGFGDFRLGLKLLSSTSHLVFEDQRSSSFSGGQVYLSVSSGEKRIGLPEVMGDEVSAGITEEEERLVVDKIVGAEMKKRR